METEIWGGVLATIVLIVVTYAARRVERHNETNTDIETRRETNINIGGGVGRDVIAGDSLEKSNGSEESGGK